MVQCIGAAWPLPLRAGEGQAAAARYEVLDDSTADRAKMTHSGRGFNASTGGQTAAYAGAWCARGVGT